jgi:hypothetical protein
MVSPSVNLLRSSVPALRASVSALRLTKMGGLTVRARYVIVAMVVTILCSTSAFGCDGSGTAVLDERFREPDQGWWKGIPGLSQEKIKKLSESRNAVTLVLRDRTAIMTAIGSERVPAIW